MYTKGATNIVNIASGFFRNWVVGLKPK